MAVYSKIAFTATQMAVNSVSIAYRNGRDDSTFRSDLTMSAISYRAVFRSEGLDLEYLACERSDSAIQGIFLFLPS